MPLTHFVVPADQPIESQPTPSSDFGGRLEAALRSAGLPWILGALMWQWLVAESHRVSLTWHYAVVLVLSVSLVHLVRSWLAGGNASPTLLRGLVTVGFGGMLLSAITWLAFWELPAGLLLPGMIVAMLSVIGLAMYVAAPGSKTQVVLLLLVCAGTSMAIAGAAVPTMLKFTAYLFLFGVSLLFSTPAAIRAVRYHFPAEVGAALVFALGCGAAVHFWVDDGHSWLCAEVLVVWGLMVVWFGAVDEGKTEATPENDSRVTALRVSRRNTVAVVLVGTLVLRLAGWWGMMSLEKILHHAAAAACALGALAVLRWFPERALRGRRLALDLAMLLPPLGVWLWSQAGR